MKSFDIPDILITLLDEIADHFTPMVKASKSKADDFALALLKGVVSYLDEDRQSKVKSD